jgi:hypothetical protein
MLKRFLNGLIFGAGFAVALFLVSTVAFYFVFPAMIGREMVMMPEQEVIHTPPDVSRRDRFLGIGGAYSGGFSHDMNRVLSAGPGRIVGVATVDGQPLAGLRLRLGLNGSVMSRWATTSADGRYEIRVPYGKYRIDGYDLDTKTADMVLPGKIGHPQNGHSSGTFEVSEGAPGQGLNLRFVDPVILDMPKHRFSADENIVVQWKPYPGANEYIIQIYEKANAHAFGASNPIFEWNERPVMTEPIIDLGDYDIELKADHYYTVAIDASGNGWPISRTADHFSGYDFTVVD